MILSGKHLIMRAVSLLLIAVMACIQPMNSLSEKTAHAASSNKLYIGEVKLFIKKDGKESDAKSWCDSQEANKDDDETNDWGVVSGDLNKGAAGALKSDIAVYLCYQKTSDPGKAITDMAVMNEKGNYSEGEYEYILKQQRDMYSDMIDDMKDMLEEYRENYKNNVPTAIQAHDFMNAYIEDDSGKLLGDLLLDISDEDLVEVFLQANGQVVIMMQEQLAFACDTQDTTWLDRMEKYGSVMKNESSSDSETEEYYDGYTVLRNQYLKAYNKNASKADSALKKKYHEKALIILNSWEDIKKHFDSVLKYAEDKGIENMSEKDVDSMCKGLAEDAENDELDSEDYIFLRDHNIMSSLLLYRYGNYTLLDYLTQSKEEVSGENITQLYPLAACLTDGQLASINESVSLYDVLINALSATALNDTGQGKAAELEASLDTESEKKYEEAAKEHKDEVDDFAEMDPISVYDGVDRGIYEGGVAVTSIAKDYGNGDESNWAETFVESGTLTKTAIGMAAGSALCAGAAVLFSVLSEKAAQSFYKVVLDGHQVMKQVPGSLNFVRASKYISGSSRPVEDATFWTCRRYTYKVVKDYKNYCNTHTVTEETFERMEIAHKEVFQRGSAGVFRALKIGFTVLCIILAVSDIVLTGIALYNYYNIEHIPIPNYMVDMTYNEDSETSFVAYKSVPDQKGKNGDLNGGGGKQWLALYATYDPDAGDPILAPDDNEQIVVQKKNTTAPMGFSPLHLFGKPNSAQNLTFADSQNGWSYNDKEGGIYLFFKRDPDAFYVAADGVDGYATVMSGRRIVLFTGIGTVVGMIIGCVMMYFIVKRKRKTVSK